ncbi:hypothetical protein BDV93DRAFT_528373 [Ceratobasidium sp. AG-I]|nr:hypothetical protein BDV93DRAFT_528373 [Ceratobasidium sp. AG-I]
MVASAALNVPNTNFDTYFFKGDQYIKVHWNPSTLNSDTLAYGPAKFADDSPALKATGFSYIDAVLPIPGNDQQAHFFSGSQYMRVNSTLSQGAGQNTSTGTTSYTIASGWPGLKAAGFDTGIDAALVVPNTTDQAFFFKGDKYCRISFNHGPSSNSLLEGPTNITTGWAAMNVSYVDFLIPRPGGPVQHAYVFTGPNYIPTDVTGTGQGKQSTPPRAVATYFKGSLAKAGFY